MKDCCRCGIILLLMMQCVAPSWGNTFVACNDTFDTAIEYCRSRNNEAMICYNNGDYDKAVECWSELLDFDYEGDSKVIL